MQVPYGLPCPGAAIDDEPVAGLFQTVLPGQAIGKLHGVAQEGRVRLGGVGERRNVRGGHDQQMGWCLRMEITKRHEAFCFSDDLGWQRAIGDPAKDALLAARHPLTRRLVSHSPMPAWRQLLRSP